MFLAPRMFTSLAETNIVVEMLSQQLGGNFMESSSSWCSRWLHSAGRTWKLGPLWLKWSQSPFSSNHFKDKIKLMTWDSGLMFCNFLSFLNSFPLFRFLAFLFYLGSMNIREKEDSSIINTNSLPDFSAISFVLHVHKENMGGNMSIKLCARVQHRFWCNWPVIDDILHFMCNV